MDLAKTGRLMPLGTMHKDDDADDEDVGKQNQYKQIYKGIFKHGKVNILFVHFQPCQLDMTHN